MLVCGSVSVWFDDVEFWVGALVPASLVPSWAPPFVWVVSVVAVVCVEFVAAPVPVLEGVPV